MQKSTRILLIAAIALFIAFTLINVPVQAYPGSFGSLDSVNAPPKKTPTATRPPAIPTNTPGGPTATPSPYRRIAYFTQWSIYGRNYLVKNVDTSASAAKLTHINYAFGNIKDGDLTCYIENRAGYGDAWADFQKGFRAGESVDGIGDDFNQPLAGNFNQLKKLKAKHPHLKTLISLGGWTWSRNFSDAALTAASRSKFVASCIDLYIKGNLPILPDSPKGGPGSALGVFDGIDIDWEYPAAEGNVGNVVRPEDTQNFTLLLAEFRRQLNNYGAQTGKYYLLTVAVGAGEDKFTKMELGQIHQHLDWINLMTYDFYGAFDADGPTNFHAQLFNSPNNPAQGVANTYSGDYAVNAFLAAGVPANKLVLGVPLYGRGWKGVPNVNNGLYQPATGPAQGKWEAGINDYKVLKGLNYPQFRDPITKSFWIYGNGNWWSYDDPTAMTDKMNYIKSKGMGGAMAWSLDGDDGTLVNTIYNGLR